MDPKIIFLMIGLIALFALFGYLIIREGKYEKKKQEEMAAAADEGMHAEAEAEPEAVAIGARVLQKELYGRHAVHFRVIFLTDEGEKKEFPVTEALYNAIEVDQTGTLVTINGFFLDFGAGEELTEDEEMEEEEIEEV